MAKGFCTCKRDFPGEPKFWPPDDATWHYLCDKPLVPRAGITVPRIVPTGTGWPVK